MSKSERVEGHKSLHTTCGLKSKTFSSPGCDLKGSGFTIYTYAFSLLFSLLSSSLSPLFLYSRKFMFSDINTNFNHSLTDNSHQYPFVSFTATGETILSYTASKYIFSTTTCIHSFIRYAWLLWPDRMSHVRIGVFCRRHKITS